MPLSGEVGEQNFLEVNIHNLWLIVTLRKGCKFITQALFSRLFFNFFSQDLGVEALIFQAALSGSIEVGYSKIDR
jgi:hypothetical protein